jgi:hypothetical protein
MTWTYAQKTGDLLHDGTQVGSGYSGYQDGKNNPDMQAVVDVGPIPQGTWAIEGPPVNTPEHGPYVLTLQPAPDTNTFGRDGFLMHGDSIDDPGNASRGCIVMPHDIRVQVWTMIQNSGDTQLEVVADLEAPDLDAGMNA